MDANTDANIGKEVGGGSYRIISRINCGTFGCVYRAQHTIFDNAPIVAIKLIHTPMMSPEEREVSLREARLLNILKHKHILPIIQAGVEHDILHIVMEYAEGGSLQDHLQRQNGRPLPQEEAFRILKQVGAALHYAHQQHIVHRDLKPDNILFNARGEALLADFGIAAILLSGTERLGRGGTPAYMAPEQFEGWVSPKNDQYALGCIAYELLTGRKPFKVKGVTLENLWYQHAKVAPITPKQYNQQLADAVAQAILTALKKERTARYKDIATFLEALSSQKTARQWFDEGNAFFAAHKYEEAVKAYDEAIRLQPTFNDAFTNRGAALNKLGKNDEALQAQDTSIQLSADDAIAHYNRGNVLKNMGRNIEAIAAYQMAIQLKPKYVEAYINMGNALAKQKEYQRAAQAFLKATELKPDDPLAYYNLGNVQLALENYEKAVHAYKTAILLKPDYAIAYHNKGIALDEMGKSSEAQQAYAQAQLLGFKE